MSAKKRNDVWDIARGLGMLFVVAGHGFSGDISRFVNLFHIPLFFFVSGLVFSFKDRSFKSAADFFISCLRSLWLPSLLYGIFYVLLHNVFVSAGLYDLDAYSVKQTGIAIIKHIGFMKTEPLESAMWFLTAIFIGRCLLYAVLWVSSLTGGSQRRRDTVESILVSLIFAAGCLFFYKNVSLPGNADNACSLVPFMYAGYRMKKTELSRKWLIIPSFLIMLGIIIFSGHTLRMSRNEIVDPLFFVIAGASGVCFTFQLAFLLKKWKPCLKTFCYIGQNTIPVLCLHLLAFRLISFIWIKCDSLPFPMLSKHPIIESSYLWGALYTAVGLALPLIVPVIKNRIKKIKRS